MNVEAVLDNAVLNPDLLVITGSRLYGTARVDEQGNIISDTDLRGFVIPPWEFLTVRNWNQKDLEGDHVVYNIKFFIAQLLACNPQLLECLFAPPSHVVKCTDIGSYVLKMRNLFVSKRFYKRILGFSNSEWRKAQGKKLIIEKRSKTEDDVIMDIRNVFGPRFGEQAKEIMDDVLSLLFSRHDTIEVSSVDGISRKRRDEFERFGYCSSSACHALRLVRQCTELLTTGKMTFPRPDAPELFAIKHGKMTLDQVIPIYNAALAECETAIKTSTLPDSPDCKKIQEMYEDVVAFALANDLRLKERSTNFVVSAKVMFGRLPQVP